MEIDIDAWKKSMDELFSGSTSEDDEAMRAGIASHKQQAKEQVRREIWLFA